MAIVYIPATARMLMARELEEKRQELSAVPEHAQKSAASALLPHPSIGIWKEILGRRGSNI